MNRHKAAAIIRQAILRCNADADFVIQDKLVIIYHMENEIGVEGYIEDIAEALKDCKNTTEFWENLKPEAGFNETIFERKYEQ